MDIGEVTDGRLVSPSLASATASLPTSYTGEDKEQEGDRGEDALMPIPVKVNKINGKAGGPGVDNGGGGNGGADKAQASTTTRAGEAVPVDDAGLDKVRNVNARQEGRRVWVGQACCRAYVAQLCYRQLP